jgi:hypothetical protein
LSERARDTGIISNLVSQYKEANNELKKNVPSQTAGLKIVDNLISRLERLTESSQQSGDVLEDLNALSRMHILAGVEESNGYGELGRWNRDEEKVELNHISDKDGSLAAYEFMEMLSYGKYIKAKSAYSMYTDLLKDIGMVCTVNSALYHPGLTGVEEKLNEMEAFEKIFAYSIQKKLDKGEKITLFAGYYNVTRVEIYRDGKYDNNFLGFTEEVSDYMLLQSLAVKLSLHTGLQVQATPTVSTVGLWARLPAGRRYGGL